MSKSSQKTKKLKYESNPFKVIFNGFDRLFKYNQNMAIIIILLGIINMISQFFDSSSSQGNNTSNGLITNNISSTGEIFGLTALVLVMFVIVIYLSVMVSGFMAYVAYMTSQEKTITLKQAYRAVSNKFWTILKVQVIVFLKIIGGTLLFIIPGIRASLRYNMALMPLFAKNTDAKGALTTSKKITSSHLMEIFGMNVAAALIPFVGQAMLVGGQSIVYTQLEELHRSGALKPKTHWLNYFTLALVVLLAFIIIGFVMIFAYLITINEL